MEVKVNVPDHVYLIRALKSAGYECSTCFRAPSYGSYYEIYILEEHFLTKILFFSIYFTRWRKIGNLRNANIRCTSLNDADIFKKALHLDSKFTIEVTLKE